MKQSDSPINSTTLVEFRDISKLFDEILFKELNVRYLEEEQTKEKIVKFTLTIIKTIKLSTLFTTSGLENIKTLVFSDKDISDFVFDLNDCFSLYLSNILIQDIEIDVFRVISNSLGYKKDTGNKTTIFDENDFQTPKNILEILISNKWLLTIVMLRLVDLRSIIPDVKKLSVVQKP